MYEYDPTRAKQYEDLITQARTVLDRDQRQSLYTQAQQILWEQAAESFCEARIY